MIPPVKKKISADTRIRGFIKLMRNRTSRNLTMAENLNDDDLEDFYTNETYLDFRYLTVFGDMCVSEAASKYGYTSGQIKSYYKDRKESFKSYVVSILRDEFEELGGGDSDQEFCYLSKRLSTIKFPRLRPHLQFHTEYNDDE